MKKIFIPLLCFCVFFAVQAQNPDTSPMRKVQAAGYMISKYYVDPVDEDKLAEEAVLKMLEQLDPHSTYLNPAEVKKLNEPLQGNFEGIGIQFRMDKDTLLVMQVVEDGPSEKAGLIVGDRIVAVNDTVIAGVKMKQEEVVKRLRGPQASLVNVTVFRQGKGSLVFTIKRDKIPIHSLDAAYMIQPKTGYIRLSRFGATTGDEFTKALKELQKKGMKDLIIDLQGNGGGHLKAAVAIANEILDPKELIVYTEEKNAKRNDFLVDGEGNFRKGRLVVLIDERSASASEIISGAVQDWDRGVIVGRRSFGKGLVQRPFNLPDGSMIRLTIARYYTPAGRCIQKPYESTADLKNSLSTTSGEENRKSYRRELLERMKSGELTNADSIHFSDSLKVFTKKLRRTVYGGGGIMPDFFVPVDTALYTSYHSLLLARGVILRTSMTFVKNNWQKLTTQYTNFEKFNKRFVIGEDILSLLREQAGEHNITFDKVQYESSLPLIKTQLKALIARELWGKSGYFQVMNTVNPIVEKALEVLAKGEYQSKLK